MAGGGPPLPPEALSPKSFWGQIIRRKCGVCLQNSGWKTVEEARQWELTHVTETGHLKFLVSMKKFT